MQTKLKLEEILVESFATGEALARAGTVRGHESVHADDASGYVSCKDTCHTCPSGLGPACCVDAE